MSIKRILTFSAVILIVGALVSTGIGNILINRNHEEIVAKVGKEKILLSEYEATCKNELSYIRQTLGYSPTEEQILSIKYAVLQRLIEKKLLFNLVDELNLRIGEESIKKYIKSMKYFQDEQGKFSKNKFIEILKYANLTEDEYIGDLKKTLPTTILMNCLFGNLDQSHLPFDDDLINKMYQNRHQRRIADVIKITPSVVKQIPYPEEHALQDLYEKYKSNFYTPEYRTIKYAQVEPKHFEGDAATEIEAYDAALTIEEISSKYNIDLHINTIGPMDRNGKDQNGNKSNNLPEVDAFTQAVFSIDDNKTHFFSFSTDQGFQNSHFFVTVIDIIAPKLKDFQESKPSLVELWHNEFIDKQMYEVANDLKSKLQAGVDISNIEGIELSKGQVFNRFEIKDAERLAQPKDLIDEIFTIKAGSLTKPIKGQGDILVGVLKGIQSIDEKADEMTMKTMKDELVRGSIDALKEQLIRHLYDKYRVKIDNSKILSYY